jgi:hypothetical protein
MRLEELTTSELIALYAAKGPVCLCPPNAGCNGAREQNFCGPQRQAERAHSLLIAYGVILPQGLATAVSHARIGEGRDEFERIMRAWSHPPLTLLHLRDIKPRLRRMPLDSWWGWDSCECGDEFLVPPSAYDGDHVVCVGCGVVASVSADEDGACISDPHSQLVPAALAGFWRLLGIKK